MRGTVFTLMCCMCAVASAATVYKWVDENGITHYSDQPHENAAKVDVQPQTYTTPPVAAPAAVSKSPAPKEAAYTSCAIAAPKQEQVFLNTFTVTAQVSVQPGQRAGDRIVLTLDGQPLNLPSTGEQFTLTEVDRGSHVLQATIQDKDGQTVCQSSAVTFHVRQPSLLAPNRQKH